MTISGALSIALTGLTTSARSAEIVSNNVANATTEGYGRRTLQTSSLSLGGQGSGVRANGVQRDVNQPLINDRRLSQASTGYFSETSSFYVDLEASIGLPEEPGSLNGRMVAFEASLIEAISRPDSETRLTNVLSSAQSLTETLHGISNDIQTARMQADDKIATQVGHLNDSLQKIDALNSQILRLGGRDTSALMDQRQVLIDGVSDLIPVRELPRDNGQIALYTTTGAVLVDGTASEFGFASVGTIVPEMTLGSGALSGLTLNGQSISTTGKNGPIAGGGLASLFEIRDQHAVKAQEQVDAVARDVVDRFSNLGGDPTLGITVPSLFTDNGAEFDPLDEIGLSSRISVSGLVNPEEGGEIWRLRAGLDASTPGDVGDSTVLNSFSTAFSAPRVALSGGLSSAALGAGELAGKFLSATSTERLSEQSDLSFSQARMDALRTSELSDGVDTDQELQKLLLIENAYAANARVIQTAEQMLDTLLGL